MRFTTFIFFLISLLTSFIECSSGNPGNYLSEIYLKRSRPDDLSVEMQGLEPEAKKVFREELKKTLDTVIEKLPRMTKENIPEEMHLNDAHHFKILIGKILSSGDHKSMEHILRLELPIKDVSLRTGASVLDMAAKSSLELFKVVYNSGIVFKAKRDYDFFAAYLSALVSDNEKILEFLEQERQGAKNAILAQAVTLGKASFVDKILKKGANPNLRVENYALVLHKAILTDNKTIVNLLLRAGANPQLYDEKQYNAVMIAAVKGKLESLKALLDYGVSTEISMDKELNLLHASIAAGHFNVVEYLYNHGLNFTKQNGSTTFVLWFLAKTSSTRLLEYVLDLGGNVYEKIEDHLSIVSKFPQFVSRLSGDDYAAVISVLASRPQNLELFLKHGFNPNVRIFHGNSTLLHVACELNDVKIAKILIKYGADVNALDSYNRTAISLINNPVILIEIMNMNEFL